MTPSLLPDLTFHEIYGPDHVFCPRSSDRLGRWLPRSPTVIDHATGAMLPVAGELPVVCARGTITPSGEALLREAGLPRPSRCVPYRDAEEYLEVVRREGRAGRRLVVQYLHAPDEIPSEAYWVPPGLLSHLNNKATLAELVPPEAVARRRILSTERLETLRDEEPPFVLKAVTDESHGGGLDVILCRRPADLERAPGLFEGVDRIVVEEFLPLAANLCLGFVVFPDGDVRYIGTAEQVIREDGLFQGNWLRGDLQVPDRAVAMAMAATEAAADRGYRGCAGIDVGVLESGRIVVFDLNFRVNSSTAAVLLHSSVAEQHSFRVARLAGWKCERGFETMIREASRAMEAGHLLPLGTHDPTLHGHDAPALLRGLLLAESREELPEKDALLAEGGLVR